VSPTSDGGVASTTDASITSPTSADSVESLIPPQLVTMGSDPIASTVKLTVPKPVPAYCTRSAPSGYHSGVDDLTALTVGTDIVEGNTLQICPSLPVDWKEEVVQPESTVKPCGPAACPNRQIAIGKSSGVVVHVLFYDNPERHLAPAPGSSSPSGSCDYHIYAMTVSWIGKGPQ
jgi:hypothetical protein